LAYFVKHKFEFIYPVKTWLLGTVYNLFPHVLLCSVKNASTSQTKSLLNNVQ